MRPSACFLSRVVGFLRFRRESVSRLAAGVSVVYIQRKQADNRGESQGIVSHDYDPLQVVELPGGARVCRYEQQRE